MADKQQIIDFVQGKIDAGSAEAKELLAKLAEDKDGDGVPDIQQSLAKFFDKDNLKAKGEAVYNEVHETFGKVLSSEHVDQIKNMVKDLVNKD